MDGRVVGIMMPICGWGINQPIETVETRNSTSYERVDIMTVESEVKREVESGARGEGERARREVK
jgi:hypothetical protein